MVAMRSSSLFILDPPYVMARRLQADEPALGYERSLIFGAKPTRRILADASTDSVRETTACVTPGPT